MKISNVGIDLVEVKKFRQNRPSKKVFTNQELKYCSFYDDQAPHLAGFFAAKEAASKALGTQKYPFYKLEIRHSKSGQPAVFRGSRKLPVLISITHIQELAVAIAVVKG